jgi:PEP-CTERM motif
VVFGGKTWELKGKQVMKFKFLAFAAATSFLASLTAQANIIGVNYSSENSAALNCPYYYWPGGTGVNVVGTQYSGPGSVNFSVTTDTPADPTLTLGNNILNDTGFAWSGYEVTVTMGQTFSLSSALVTVPPDWFVSSIVQPGAPVAGVYTGNIFLSAGTPVQINQNLDFSYQLSFTGSVQFTETLTPTPEPGTCTLLLGGLALGGWIARKRRS